MQKDRVLQHLGGLCVLNQTTDFIQSDDPAEKGAPGELEWFWSVCRVSTPRMPNSMTCFQRLAPQVVAIFNSTLGLRSALFLAKRGYDTWQKQYHLNRH